METLELLSLHEKLKVISNDRNELEKLTNFLSTFKCTKNLQEEKFIKNNAIDFDINNLCRTYLCMKNNKFIAYFSLAIKAIELNNHAISKSLEKKITSHLQSECRIIAGYLIGHFAKDENVNIKISNYLMRNAISIINESSNNVGGRIIFLECENNLKLINIYERFGFKYLSKRIIQHNKILLIYYKLI